MAVVLSARLMVRYADKYDPDLAAAFEKLGGGPAAGAPRARRPDASTPVAAPDRRGVQPPRPAPDAGLGGAAGRRARLRRRRRYAPEAAPRSARVRPYLIEPSLQTHALYLIGWDETRERDPDVQDRADPRRVADARLVRRRRSAEVVDGMFERAWDIIADQEPVDVVLRFAPTVASRVREARWHPTERVDGRRRTAR